MHSSDHPKVVSIDVRHIVVRVNELIANREFRKSLDLLLVLNKQFPDDSQVLTLVVRLCVELELIDEALVYAELLLEKDGSAKAYRMLANAKMAAKEYEDALDLYRISVKSFIDERGSSSLSSLEEENRLYRKSIYEDGWKQKEELIKKMIADGEASLSRALRLWRPYGIKDNPSERGRFLYVGNDFFKGSSSYETMKLTTSAYKDMSMYDFCSRLPTADWIVELGSGAGHNLFKMWLNNGPYHAKYISAEYTESGRKCSRVLASLAPEMNFFDCFFDYHSTPLSEVIPSSGTGLVFTNFSIEQIPLLRNGFIDELAELPGVYEVMHLEPVAWQLTDLGFSNPCGRESDDDFIKYMKACELENHRRLFNLNLGEMLRGAISRDKIVIDEDFSTQVSCASSVFNPGARLIWSPKR